MKNIKSFVYGGCARSISLGPGSENFVISGDNVESLVAIITVVS